jgi:hypothetical protein
MAGAAVSALAQKLDIEPEGTVAETEQAVIAALETGSPTTWAQVRKADQDFKVQLEQLGIKLEEVHQRDRDSARQRQVQLKDKAPIVLGVFILGTFLSVVVMQFMILFKQLPIDPAALRGLDISFGILGGAVMSVVTYYFGSSSSSARKTELLGSK